MTALAFLRGAVWVSRPPGLCIFALADGVTVESGGQLLIGLRMRRPEAVVLLDEAILTLPGQHGYQETKKTPAMARTWAESATVRGPQGQVQLGPLLVQAWDQHVLLYREALARAPGIVA